MTDNVQESTEPYKNSNHCAHFHYWFHRLSPLCRFSQTAESDLSFKYDDFLIAPDLPDRSLRDALGSIASSSPGYYETSEYLIGSVAVGVVLLQSNGSSEPSTEYWSYTRQLEVVNERARAYCYKTISLSSELYARAYFEITASGTADNDDRFYLIILKSGGNPVAFAGWRQTAGVVKWNLIIRNGASWATAYSTNVPSLNQWYCVELYWKKDSANGIGELWINGQIVCVITGKNTAAYGNADRLEFGLPEIINCARTTAYCDCASAATAYVGPEP